MPDFLAQDEALELIDAYMENEWQPVPLQVMLDSGAVPKLRGFVVRPGKVSDCVFGGEGDFSFDMSKEPFYDSLLGNKVNKEYFTVTEDGKPKDMVRVRFENPALDARDGTPLILMARSQRISTHDIQRGDIPFKDQILASNHNFMRRMLADFIGTSQHDAGLPDNSVVIAAEKLAQIGFENVLRAYMARSTTSTSLYVHYMNGERNFCGHKLPDGLYPNCILPCFMDTPSTKSEEHDVSVSPDQLFEMGICTSQQYKQIRHTSLAAYEAVRSFLYPMGKIAVDTKTEHGINKRGDIVAQDEEWTMDSSRFWLRSDYERQLGMFLAGKDDELLAYLRGTQPGLAEKDYMWNGRAAITPRSLSKEFARGYSKGKEGYTPDQRRAISARYIEGVQELLGKRFEPDTRPYEERVITGLRHVVDTLAV